MLKGLYEKIRQDAAPTIIGVDNRPYSDKQIYPVHLPIPKPLIVKTLTGLVDYIKSDIEDVSIGSIFCHVISPSEIEIISGLQGEFLDRACFIRAQLDQIKLPFNQWMDAESFNIAMQACFVDPHGKDTDKTLVLAYTSNVRAISETAVSDDGVTQAVEVKAGIASKAITSLPNPVTLRPYRTFTEIEQPESKFIFRCRSEGGKMQFMLIEADGGAWRSVAMESIKNYMKQSLPKLQVIA